MRALVACEYSGRVRNAFRALGHDAWSCDLLPSEDNSPFHIIGSALPLLSDGWDLLIAHPPCTFLCNSGVRWLSDGKTLNTDRYEQMKAGCRLFSYLWHAPISRVCIENPVMHRYAREYLAELGVPSFTQSIQPWQFGHGEVKRTCLWLRGLPNLAPTELVSGRVATVHRMAPSPDRWKERSRTYQGIATAMAKQWNHVNL